MKADKSIVLGHAEVRQTIHVPSVGTIAGCYILDGKVVTDTKEIENIKAAFRPSSSSNRQTAAGIDEKDQVKPFTLNVADVHHISINKQKLVIIH